MSNPPFSVLIYHFHLRARYTAEARPVMTKMPPNQGEACGGEVTLFAFAAMFPYAGPEIAFVLLF